MITIVDDSKSKSPKSKSAVNEQFLDNSENLNSDNHCLKFVQQCICRILEFSAIQ